MIAADAPTAGSPLDVVSLPRLMERTVGRPEIAIGLIDGPVAAGHADLVAASLRSLPSPLAGPSGRPSGARAHGTYVAGILSARRGSAAPAICPRCTLLVRPIFLEPSPGTAEAPSASPGELAAAIVDCIQAGAPRLTCQRKVIATWQESCSEPLPPIFSTTTAPTARFQRSESDS